MNRPSAICNTDEFITCSQAAKMNSVTRQSIYVAIRKGKIPIKKKRGLILIRKNDLERYTETKYSRQDFKYKGELIYDKSKGLYSVAEVSDILGIPRQRLYYDLRINRVAFDRKGTHYVIHEADIKCYSSLLSQIRKR